MDDQLSVFLQDVLLGLRQYPKRISSRYLYDERGSRLFQQIMALPEYYLTRLEYEILEASAPLLAQKLIHQTDSLQLVDLGAGDGSKTSLLVEELLQAGMRLRYVPVDFSEDALRLAQGQMLRTFPSLDVQPRQGDYFEVMRLLACQPDAPPMLVLFLGSSIGNLLFPEAVDFCRLLFEALRPSDQVLIGFDLKKEPSTILAAYDDARGVTRDFNFNLLERMNRELGADFDLRRFRHHAFYDPQLGAARSFLVSTCRQQVRFSGLDTPIDFQAWEAIDVEVSCKYDLPTIERMARQSGFEVELHFQDPLLWYAASLWKRP